jgi:methyl-accepting chemotaxis protein
VTAFFRNARIRTRLLAAVLPALIGLTGMSAYMVVNAWQTSAQMGALQEMAELAPVSSALVHELQKERGTSAGFLGSAGEGGFRTKLDTQRQATDKARNTAARAFNAFTDHNPESALVDKLRAAEKRLANVASMRERVSRLEIATSEMVGFYSAAIRDLIEVISVLGDLADDADITQMVSAYIGLIEAKERAGLERAMGANGFGQGSFPPAIHAKMTRLIAQQDAFLLRFRAQAVPAQIAAFDAAMDIPAVDTVDRMRELALANGYGNGGLEGITGPQWFETITRKIDALKGVEDGVAADLTALAAAVRSAAATKLFAVAAVALVLLLGTLGVVVAVIRSISAPVARITGVMTTLAEGDKTVAVPEIGRGDEIGDMARATEVFKQAIVRQEELAEEQRQKQAAEVARGERLQDLTRTFDADVNAILQSVGTAGEQLNQSAQSMSSVSEETSRQAQAVAAASEQASTNVETVASGCEELTSAIGEINNQIAHSTSKARHAREMAESASTRVGQLSEAADKIGEVIDLIEEIAEKTNLLALNAPIEAARAGDAGKGFAVVAQEVKSLAEQTSKATAEISGRIDTVQAETKDAVTAIEQIAGGVKDIDEATAAIAAAIEEQGTATGEIARNVQEASTGTKEVNANITGVSQAAGEAGSAAEQVLAACGDLNEQSRVLNQKVETFLADVRAV